MMPCSPGRHARRLGLFVATCAAIAAAGCNSNTADSAKPAPAVVRPTSAGTGRPSVSNPVGSADVATVRAVTVDDPLLLPAQLYVDYDVVIVARASGVLEHLNVDLGTSVVAGAVLATVESRDQQIAVAQAEAAFDDAQRTAQRVRTLTPKGGATVADSDSAEFAVRRAGITVDSARRALSLTTVTAPFAGNIAARYVGPYRFVHVGDTLFRLTQSRPLLVRVHVPESRPDALILGARATVEGVDNHTSSAHVIRVAPTVDAASGTREVVLAIDRGGDLRPGSAVIVRLGTAPRRVVVVPTDVISDDGYVVVLGGAQPALRLVRLGDELPGGQREVLSGLVPGERVRRPGP